MTHIDQLGRSILLTSIPKRVISLVPSQTELLVDLGVTDTIVGLTKFCVHPNYLRKEKSVIGGTKQVHFDKIRALRPDLIICNKEENTKEMVAVLETIAPVWISDIKTIDDNNEMITLLGRIFDVNSVASEIVSEIETERLHFEKYIRDKPLKKVAYFIWKNPYMAAGGTTFINYLLTLNRFNNIFETRESRYPEVLIRDAKNVDLILLSSEPYPFSEKDSMQLQEEGLREIKLVDGEYFSWYGSRLKDAFGYFKTLR